MKLAFVYAGQGSQHVGMGKDFYENYSPFANIFDHAPVSFDLKQLCFAGPENQLSQTRFTQPCMAAFAVGVTDLLYQEGIRPQAAAGLSLGEYSALYAAGVFSRGTVISLVAFRGQAMEQAAAGLNCSMTAVLGLDREKLQSACEGAAELGVVQICNYNCPGQLVIGGGGGPPTTPSPPCWSGRSSPLSTGRTPFAAWRQTVWTLWWRLGPERRCAASLKKPPPRSKPGTLTRWKTSKPWYPP